MQMTMIESKNIGALICAFLVLDISKAQTTQFTVTPMQLTLGGPKQTPNLTINCIPSADGLIAVNAVEIGTKLQNRSEIYIVQIEINNPNSVKVSNITSLRGRIKHNGTIAGPSSYLELVISNPQCSDALEYYCAASVSIGTAQNFTRLEQTANVTAMAYPKAIRMEVMPDQSQYDKNTLVDFKCSGRIGMQANKTPKHVWVWQWRYTSGKNTRWSRYPDMMRIAYETSPNATNCLYNANSTLMHLVIKKDNGRQFRCYVISEEYAASRTISFKTPGQPATDAPGQPATDAPSGTAGTYRLGVLRTMLILALAQVLSKSG